MTEEVRTNKRKRLSLGKTKKDSVSMGAESLASGDGVSGQQSSHQQCSIFLASKFESSSDASSQAKASSQGAEAPPSQSKRKKVPVQRLGQSEVDNYDTNLELALRLSAEEAKKNEVTVASRQLNPDADHVQAASGVSGAEAHQSKTPAAKTKTEAEAAVASAACSVHVTKKKQTRLQSLDSEESDRQNSIAPPNLSTPNLVSSVQNKQAPVSSKCKARLIDSDDEQQSEMTKPGHLAGELDVNECRQLARESRLDAAQKNARRSADSDTIPDSEDELEGRDNGSSHEKEGPAAQKKGCSKTETRKRVVQDESSEEEEMRTGNNKRIASLEPSITRPPPAKCASTKHTGKGVLSGSGSESEDVEVSEFSEVEESDDDFESVEDEDEDFKRSTKSKQKDPKKRKLPAVPSKASSRSNDQASRPLDVPEIAQKMDCTKKPRRRKSELDGLAFSNPGVKAVVPKDLNRGLAAAMVPLKTSHAPAANGTAALVAATDAGARGGERGFAEKKIAGAQSTPGCKGKQPAESHAPGPAPATKGAPAANSNSTAIAATAGNVGVMRQQASASIHAQGEQKRTQSGVGEGGSAYVASLPPRVGLVRHMSTSAPLHKAQPCPLLGPLRPADRSSAGGVKIVGGSQGVRRPGLSKTAVVRQQLHPRPEH